MTDVTGAPFMKTCTSEAPNIPAASHRFVTSINMGIIARPYLSGVKRKNAPAVICSAFGPAGARPGSSQGSLTIRSQKHAGIWLRGRWVSFRRGEGGMCFSEWGGGGGGVLEVVGASEPGPKISLTSYSERKT